ncbi:hypothetical protein PgNI_11288 [Pyricularia grisea]|uniref:beta-glucosidase n=1 Tax=Pyricularia grisea TaxID=148305 RepID=A0A6P8APZ1_PYRGI|nr:hypothetical protein PgNI_11288 [Pyricularia grisea]TLD04095.1 hypothetical protein PgNI_11288 [Pyricularia grisea]
MTKEPYLDVDDVISRLTIEEKVALLSGKDFWQTRDVPRLNVPSLRFTDGPNGARGQRFFNGTPAACFPCGTGLAATWDVGLIEHAGATLGEECKARGAHVSLGPTINIQRSPLGGRGFESYSEDPVLSGLMASAMVKGVQSTGVAACLKHYVCNDQEHERQHRQAYNAVISERALREIYLMPFQIAQRDSNPLTYMTSYNRVNGLHVSENPRLMQYILRDEWKFDGLIMSDWFGTYSAAESTKAGLDIEMPGPPRVRGPNIVVSLGSRKLTEHTVDQRVRNLLNLTNRVACPERPFVTDSPEKTDTSIPAEELSSRMHKIASDGLVLLKNNNNILPLSKEKTVAVIGPNANIAAYAGGGSASLRPTYTTTPLDGILKHVPSAKYTLGAAGYKQLPALSLISKTPDGTGRKGVLCKFYNEPAGHEERILRDTVHTDLSDMLLVDYSHPDVSPELFYMDIEGDITPEQSGEYMFGCSVRGTAKVLVDGQLVVDNATTQVLGGTFMGAGTREERGSVTLEAGRTYRVVLQFGSSQTQRVKKKGATAMRGGGVRLGCAAVLDADAEIRRAVDLAASVDQVVLVVGLTGEWESEGFDRDNMDLPGWTNDLVRAVVAANPNTAVVVQSGTPVEMPWVDEVPAIMQSWFGGNEGGNAIASVLFGHVNPSGKLPLSFPKRLEDNPAFLNFGSENGRTLYGEDVYVGYRFYERTKKEVLFPFGHGLSYTTFEINNCNVDVKVPANGDDIVLVSADVANTGTRDGQAVVQVYIRQLKPSIKRPPKELKGFQKLAVKAGAKASVAVTILEKYATSYWDEERDQWISEAGEYDVLVGQSSADVTVAGHFSIAKTTWWKGL